MDIVDETNSWGKKCNKWFEDIDQLLPKNFASYWAEFPSSVYITEGSENRIIRLLHSGRTVFTIKLKETTLQPSYPNTLDADIYIFTEGASHTYNKGFLDKVGKYLEDQGFKVVAHLK